MSIMSAHLVGSIPFDDAATVFQRVSASLGDGLKRIPDGETGERQRWIFWQRGKLAEHPAMEPDTAEGPARIHQWDGKLIREWDLFRFKDGVDPATVTFDTGYAPEARRSYEVFRELRDTGAIAAHLKFQVCLPTPMAVGYWFVSPASRADFFAAYERAITATVAEICDAVPHADLAIQWDVCQEVLVWEDYFPTRPDTYKEDILGELARLGDAVPEPVELGYHLCYGTPNDEHIVMPTDLAVSVEIANGVFSRLARSVQFLHMPVPKARDDAAYFAPLADLPLPGGFDLYLGLVHHDDGDGDARRITAARQIVGTFGVATECGWGRGDPGRVTGLLESHRRAIG